MPTLAGLTTYGVSYAGLWAAILADIVPEDLRFPLVMVWSVAGVVLAVIGIAKGRD